MTSDVLRPLRFYASLLAGAALCLALPAFADAAPLSGAAVTPKPERFILSTEKQHLYRYAFVVRQGVARSAPRKTAAVVRSLARWTPEGTTNLVLTLDGRRTRRGVWIRVRLATTAERPNRLGTAQDAERLEGGPDPSRRRPPAPDGDALPARQGRLPGPGGRGPAELADAARRVLHPQPALRLRQSRLRADRVRDERALGGADRLAGRWVHRICTGRTSRRSFPGASRTDAFGSGTATFFAWPG